MNACTRSSCQCTHEAPCEFGWIDTDQGVLHCETCKPHRRQEPYETRKQWQARLQTQNLAAQTHG